MQPHSTCAIALANYIYNHYHEPYQARGIIRIEYQDRYGMYRNLIYSFSDLTSYGERFRQGFRVWVKKSGDPLSCMLYVKTYDGEYRPGKRFVITHGTQHRAGLEEHFELCQKSIQNGHHLNSVKYGDFGADLPYDKYIQVYASVQKAASNERSHMVMSIKIDQISEDPIVRSDAHQGKKAVDLAKTRVVSLPEPQEEQLSELINTGEGTEKSSTFRDQLLLFVVMVLISTVAIAIFLSRLVALYS